MEEGCLVRVEGLGCCDCVCVVREEGCCCFSCRWRAGEHAGGGGEERAVKRAGGDEDAADGGHNCGIIMLYNVYMMGENVYRKTR